MSHYASEEALKKSPKSPASVFNQQLAGLFNDSDRCAVNAVDNMHGNTEEQKESSSRDSVPFMGVSAGMSFMDSNSMRVGE